MIRCCACDGRFKLIIGDQGVDCATYKYGDHLTGAYGSKHDMTRYDIVVDNHVIMGYPNNSNFCDDCVDFLLQDDTIRKHDYGSDALSLHDDLDPEAQSEGSHSG